MPVHQFELTMTQYPDSRKRNIRVWLPGGYDPADTGKRYPVLYMHDGQNLFDAAAATYGVSWDVDKAITAMMGEGYGGAIVVGVDSGPDRFNELCPPWTADMAAAEKARDWVRTLTAEIPKAAEASGDKYAAFIVRTVKPAIDARYNTRPGREHTGIGGSSAGGLQSLYMGLAYPDIFAYALCFSPALALIGDSNSHIAFDAVDMGRPGALAKLYLFCGGGDPLEKLLIPGYEFAARELLKRGYPPEKIVAVLDEKQPHNEAAWAQYFPEAYKWCVGIR